MNENTSPIDPVDSKPAALPPPPPRAGLAPMLGGAIGLLVFIGSVLLCYINPLSLLVGLVGAVVSLFYKGYRSIFLGYILTVGVALLGVIIYCSSHPFDMK